MNDQLDIGLEDNQLMAEIHLVTDLMIAAVESEGPLEQAVVDGILRVERFPRQRSRSDVR